MIVKLSERTKDYMELVIENEDHTLGNLLTKIALEDPRVSTAFYSKPHPLFDRIIFRIKTNGEDPVIVLKDIIKKIMEYSERFEKEIESAVT